MDFLPDWLKPVSLLEAATHPLFVWLLTAVAAAGITLLALPLLLPSFPSLNADDIAKIYEFRNRHLAAVFLATLITTVFLVTRILFQLLSSSKAAWWNRKFKMQQQYEDTLARLALPE